MSLNNEKELIEFFKRAGGIVSVERLRQLCWDKARIVSDALDKQIIQFAMEGAICITEKCRGQDLPKNMKDIIERIIASENETCEMPRTITLDDEHELTIASGMAASGYLFAMPEKNTFSVSFFGLISVGMDRRDAYEMVMCRCTGKFDDNELVDALIKISRAGLGEDRGFRVGSLSRLSDLAANRISALSAENAELKEKLQSNGGWGWGEHV